MKIKDINMKFTPGKVYIWQFVHNGTGAIAQCEWVRYGMVCMGGSFAAFNGCGIFPENDLKILEELPAPGPNELWSEYKAKHLT